MISDLHWTIIVAERINDNDIIRNALKVNSALFIVCLGRWTVTVCNHTCRYVVST